MRPLPPGERRRFAASVAALLLTLVAVFIADPFGDDPVPKTQTTKVDNADGDAKADDTVTLDEEAVEIKDEFKKEPGDLKPAPGSPPLSGKLVPGEPVAELQPPFAADSLPGCRTRFLRTNWSYRRVSQAQVVNFAFHYTGGPDRPGTRAEVDGLTGYGNNPTARVSWHINMDKDGNCDYNVPLRHKAWTIGNANEVTINIEVHGTGSGEYLRAGGVAKLKMIIADIRRAYPRAVKFQLGALSNCRSTRDGFITHWMGGTCSGGHTDIRPHEIKSVIKLLAGPTKAPPSPRAVDLCQTVVRVLRLHRPPDPPRPTDSQQAKANRSRAVLNRYKYACGIRDNRMVVYRK